MEEWERKAELETQLVRVLYERAEPKLHDADQVIGGPVQVTVKRRGKKPLKRVIVVELVETSDMGEYIYLRRPRGRGYFVSVHDVKRIIVIRPAEARVIAR